MLIERHDVNDTKFDKLDEGAVFLYNDIPYMKIREISKYDDILEYTVFYNAVCLGNGALESVNNSMRVHARPDSYLVIK